MEEQTAAILVARYLKANHYDETLAAFLTEANIKPSLAETRPQDWTLEKILEEKQQFDTSINFERTDQNSALDWTEPCPSIAEQVLQSNDKNVLCVRGAAAQKRLVVATAGHDLRSLTSTSPHEESDSDRFVADSPILSVSVLSDSSYVLTTMSGGTIVVGPQGNELASRRQHSKWAVASAVSRLPGSDHSMIATAAWDQKVHLYKFSHGNATGLESPYDTIELPTNPVSLVFVEHPDTKKLYLIMARQDSSFLYYYAITPDISKCEPAGRQNLAPHSNAWVAFTPSALAVHPTDPTLLAIATSHLPHLKLIIVRLLFPEDSSIISSIPGDTAAAMARRDLAIQDREDQAIKLQVSTQAPQTPYSTPQVCWRPDGSGLWVNGDDGVIRGIEAQSGKIKVLLRAHEVGSKVRTLWAGYLPGKDEEKEEVLISGGFDRRVFVWHSS